MIKRLISNSKLIFLIDCLGAFLNACLLAGILAYFEAFFGMPSLVLYILASIACVYGIYSGYCYFFTSRYWRFYLKIVVIANLAYALLTVGLVILFHQNLTALGFIYFLLELITMLILINLEWNVLTKSKESK